MTFAILLLVDKCKRVYRPVSLCKIIYLMFASMWAVLYFFRDRIYDEYTSFIVGFAVKNKQQWGVLTIAFGLIVCAMTVVEVCCKFNGLHTHTSAFSPILAL